MKKLLLWLMSTKLYSWAMTHLVWRLRMTNMYTTFTGDLYHAGYAKLSPGCFILSVDYKKAANLVIDGKFSHAAFCVSKGVKYMLEPIGGHLQPHTSHPAEIVEQVHTGFHRTWFFDMCKEADRVAIFTCLDWDDDHKKRMIDFANRFEGSGYDIHFQLGIAALYCSELVYQADKLAGGKLSADLTDLAGLGRLYISPDGLALAANAKCLWDSAGVLTGLTGPQIEARKLL